MSNKPLTDGQKANINCFIMMTGFIGLFQTVGKIKITGRIFYVNAS